MDARELEGKIDHASILMYQNQEEEALREMNALFPYLKALIGDDLFNSNKQAAAIGISMMRELIDGYKNCDMLLMADCLQEKAIIVLGIYESLRDTVD